MGLHLSLEYSGINFITVSMTASLSGPLAANQADPPPCLTAGMTSLCGDALCFSPNMALCMMNISTLASSVQVILFQNYCGLVRCNFASLSYAVIFFLERRGLFLVVQPWTLTFNVLTEAYRSHYAVFLYISEQSDHGLHFWDVHWSTQMFCFYSGSNTSWWLTSQLINLCFSWVTPGC